uniref:Uncharacterized protein n=1 Tax=candidate division WOR-3 bacterium TaxID=2052148 RepID=A0A7V3VUA1_UNCW3
MIPKPLTFVNILLKLLYKSEYVLSYLNKPNESENNCRHFICADFNKDGFGYFYARFIRFV